MTCEIHDRSSPRQCRALVALVLAAFALRLAYCAVTTGLGHTPEDHYREYILAGQRLLEHKTLVSSLILDESNTTPSALMPPAYVGLVAVVYRWLGVETFSAALVLQIFNAMATSVAAALAFVTARRLAGPVAGWTAGIATALNPALIGFTTYVWDTSLFSLSVIGCVYLSVRLAVTTTGLRRWFAFGLLLGGVALLNPALTATYPLLVLWPLTRTHGWRLRPLMAPIATTILGWLIVITPWTVRNYAQFDKLMYIRSGFMLELWLGACPEADAHGAAVFPRQFPLLNADVQRHMSTIGEEAYVSECGALATAAIKADPLRFLRLTSIRAVDYWAGTVFTHAGANGGGWPKTTARAAVCAWYSVEVAIVLLALLMRGPLRRPIVWLLAIAACFSVVYVLTHVQVRFRAPMEPVMAILVGMAIESAVRHRRQRQKHAALA